ncbi:MAG: NADH-quinone oxidoreductase subunit D, partial [Chloroflexota bacterium]|nr:NADH-quinone oxidoreductase subunit D [Chloroflexota bacterium]
MVNLPSEQITINLGPQHPSTHGVFRLRVTLDGEVITDVEPIFGYLHRGTEKLAEERTYTQVVTLTDRLDYTS